MKIRQGFVSNSSSSSFICGICGNTEAGRDMSFEDAEFVQCEHGHEFCEHHLKTDLYTISRENKTEDEDEEWDESRTELPAEHCPLCQLQELSDEDCLKYVLKTLGQTKTEILGKIKTMYGTYAAFKEVIKK